MGAIIEFKGVSKGFSGHMVLDKLDLSVEAGEVLVIIGRSGTGKSVTLKLMVGLLDPDEGSILIDGEDISGLSVKKLARVREKFGVLFQSGALLNSLTVRQNVALPIKEHEKASDAEVDARVMEKIALVEMTAAADKMPNALSGGMKKRAGLARALARAPRIVLYDEPTSGLDPVMANNINDLIAATNKKLGTTSIVVTHDMQSAYRIADRIAMLYKGKVILIGSPDEFKQSKDPYVRQFVLGETTGPMGKDQDDDESNQSIVPK